MCCPLQLLLVTREDIQLFTRSAWLLTGHINLDNRGVVQSHLFHYWLMTYQTRTPLKYPECMWIFHPTAKESEMHRTRPIDKHLRLTPAQLSWSAISSRPQVCSVLRPFSKHGYPWQPTGFFRKILLCLKLWTAFVNTIIVEPTGEWRYWWSTPS